MRWVSFRSALPVVCIRLPGVYCIAGDNRSHTPVGPAYTPCRFKTTPRILPEERVFQGSSGGASGRSRYAAVPIPPGLGSSHTITTNSASAVGASPHVIGWHCYVQCSVRHARCNTASGGRPLPVATPMSFLPPRFVAEPSRFSPPGSRRMPTGWGRHRGDRDLSRCHDSEGFRPSDSLAFGWHAYHVRSATHRSLPQKRFSTRLAFCPPKAKLFVSAYSTSLLTALWGV